MQLKEKTANFWEYKVGNNAIIAIFVCLWKPRAVVLGSSRGKARNVKYVQPPEVGRGNICDRKMDWNCIFIFRHFLGYRKKNPLVKELCDFSFFLRHSADPCRCIWMREISLEYCRWFFLVRKTMVKRFYTGKKKGTDLNGPPKVQTRLLFLSRLITKLGLIQTRVWSSPDQILEIMRFAYCPLE